MYFMQKISYIRAFMGILHGNRAFGGPVQTAIDLTNRCNIRCIHCYFYSPYVDKPNFEPVRRARQKGEELPDDNYVQRLKNLNISPDRLHSLMDEILKMGTRRFQLSGGEPLMHQSFVECVARLKHAGSYCFLNTNGILLDKATSDELIKLSLDEMRITTLAGTSEVYVHTHPGVSSRTFTHLKNILLYLSEQKSRLGSDTPKLTLAFIVTAQNADNIVEIAKFADDVKADSILYRPVDDIEDQGLSHVVPTEEQAASIQKQIGEAKAYLESKGISHNISAFQKVFNTKLDTTDLYRSIPCYYGWLSARISADGEVYPCCRCYDSLGNIYEKTFPDIWHGEAYRQFRGKAIQLPRQISSLHGCDCFSCVHHTANFRVYRALHPLKGYRVKSTNIRLNTRRKI